MKPRAKPQKRPPSRSPSPQQQLQQLELELKKACAWLREVKEMCYYIYTGISCRPYVVHLFKGYREFVLARLDEVGIESIKRVINACNVNMQLLDFAPGLQDIIVRLKEAAAKITAGRKDVEDEEEEGVEEEKKQELMRVAELLSKMKVADFVKNWGGIVETLEFYEYREELMDIYDTIAYENVLIKTLEDEIRRVAAARGIRPEEILEQLEY